jgi:transcriptional regulator with XRE-family HTH domain
MRASDLIAERVKELRQRRGLTAKQLADRCKELGAPDLTASVIANIESGRPDSTGRRRRELSVEEHLALSLALEVPPALLLLPINDELEVTPSARMDAYTFASWFTGDDGFIQAVLDHEGLDVRGDDGKDRLSRYRRDARPLDLLRNLYVSIAIFKRISAGGDAPEFKPADAAIAFNDIAQRVAHLVDWLWSIGITPPSLPRELVEILANPEALAYPMEYPAELLAADDGEAG